MSDQAWTPPDTWHCIRSGVHDVVMVDAETRREVESWLKYGVDDDRFATLDITDVNGSDFTLIRGQLVLIESSTPESRARCWAFDAKIKAERKSLGYLDDE